MGAKRVVSTTTFKKVPKTDPAFDKNGPVFEWYWTTKGINNEPLGGSQGEGYKNVLGALNGFFAQQGYSDWEPAYDQAFELGINRTVDLVVPEGYGGVVKVDANTYTVVKYDTV